MAWFMYATMTIALAVFAYGVWRRVRIWRLGRPAVRWDRIRTRLSRLAVRGLAHADLFKERLPGVMHALIFFGFAVLFAATVVVFIHHEMGLTIMRGYFYLYFQSLTVDVFGLLALAGVGIAAWRRYVRRLPRLERARPTDALLLGSLFLILVTGFVLEGARIAATADPWGRWSPGGYLAALVLLDLRLGSRLREVHQAVWLVHVALWHTALATIPFTKLLHTLTSPLNIFFGPLDAARSVVPPTDFARESAVLGIRSPFEMTWKQLLDLDACTECGRCQDACPAWAEAKPLSPKRVILDLRDHVRAHEPALLAAGAALDRGGASRCGEILTSMPPLAGGVIRAETLWACTTCRACEEACPVSIEHVPLILQLRQHLAMEQTKVPDGVGDAVNSLEARQHPFRGAPPDRTAWYRDLPVTEMASLRSSEDAEVLYWVGCAAAQDPRVAAVARALARVMHHAGVRFAVLGREEQCCGDPARRTGNEFHYEALARHNIQTLRRYRIAKIVTHCPHCLQTLKHEYRQEGGRYVVLHHTEFVRQLIEAGRVRLARGRGGGTVTFHDPCYLGRYNGIFEAPREILDRVGGRRVEMARARARSFCCGAGGGHAFFEDRSGGRIDRNRIREAAATGAETVCTACPFCLPTLLEGARTEGRGALQVRDVVEMVADALAEEN